MTWLKPFSIALALSASPIWAQEAPKPVKLSTVNAQPIVMERQFFGQVAARQSVDLAFQVSGQIVDFPVIEGFSIAQDGVIAQLDQEQFQLKLDQARLQKDQADRTVARLGKLKGNTVSQVSLDDAETQAALSAIALRNAEWALEHTTLLAPFEGLISSRNLALYSTVSAGTPVVRIHDMSELRIEVDVPEILFQRAGHETNVKISAKFPSHPETFPLEIREFDAETSRVGQTFRITFGMAPPEGLSILPGSSVTVTIQAQGEDVGLIVPATALVVKEQGEIGVMVFSPSEPDIGTVTWVAVDVTPTQSGDVRILSGLKDGDEFVTTGGTVLADGQPVRRFTGFAN
nr:efflux RND transporter periplasmic adaptor subunit [uncultured Shimia sp.]